MVSQNIIIIIIIIVSFSRQFKLVVFQWSLNDSKSPHVSRSLLSIHDDLKCAVVWMISILPLISSAPKTFSRYTLLLLLLLLCCLSWFLVAVFRLSLFNFVIFQSSYRCIDAIIIIIIIMIIIIPGNFFTLEGYLWEQVSSSLQHSSQYRGWS